MQIAAIAIMARMKPPSPAPMPTAVTLIVCIGFVYSGSSAGSVSGAVSSFRVDVGDGVVAGEGKADVAALLSVVGNSVPVLVVSLDVVPLWLSVVAGWEVDCPVLVVVSVLDCGGVDELLDSVEEELCGLLPIQNWPDRNPPSCFSAVVPNASAARIAKGLVLFPWSSTSQSYDVPELPPGDL